MKWDHTFKQLNPRTYREETIREAYFQDADSATTLRDTNNQRISLRDHSEKLQALAKRHGRVWVCTRWDDGKPVYLFDVPKERAIDFLLGNDTLPGMES